MLCDGYFDQRHFAFHYVQMTRVRAVLANQSLKLTENTACFFAARDGFTKRQNKTQ
jgi:hypothetical protein